MSVENVAERPDRKHGWCWIAGNPEQTYSDESDWLTDYFDYHGLGALEGPTIEEFQWGVPAPTTFVVIYEKDEAPEMKSFDSRAEAEAFKASLTARTNTGGTNDR